jgi:methylphosphotriester-DNA--protein-cysteine methyltransferase
VVFVEGDSSLVVNVQRFSYEDPYPLNPFIVWQFKSTKAVMSFLSNAVFRTCKRCQAANVNAHHWAWECVDQAQREAVAALLRVSPNESNKCLESIVAAMCNDKTQSEVFFGAFDYIKRAYKAQASDSGAS